MLHEQEREQDLGLRGEDSSFTDMETMASCFALSCAVGLYMMTQRFSLEKYQATPPYLCSFMK